MSYTDVIMEDQRLVILKLLNEDPDGSLNERILQRLLESWGHAVSDTDLRRHLGFLEQNLAVEVEKVGANEEIWVAKLTRAGEEHLARTRPITGIALPRRR